MEIDVPRIRNGSTLQPKTALSRLIWHCRHASALAHGRTLVFLASHL
jgi:hypothetical protein